MKKEISEEKLVSVAGGTDPMIDVNMENTAHGIHFVVEPEDPLKKTSEISRKQ